MSSFGLREKFLANTNEEQKTKQKQFYDLRIVRIVEKCGNDLPG